MALIPAITKIQMNARTTGAFRQGEAPIGLLICMVALFHFFNLYSLTTTIGYGYAALTSFIFAHFLLCYVIKRTKEHYIEPHRWDIRQASSNHFVQFFATHHY